MNIMTFEDVSARTGLSKSSIYNRVKNDPTFPRPFKLGQGRLVRFSESDIENWIQLQHASVAAHQPPSV